MIICGMRPASKLAVQTRSKGEWIYNIDYSKGPAAEIMIPSEKLAYQGDSKFQNHFSMLNLEPRVSESFSKTHTHFKDGMNSV